MRRLILLPLGWVLILAMILTLAGCGASGKDGKKAEADPTPNQKLQQVQQFEQRMSSLLDQIANQDKALSDLRVQQDQTLSKAVEANKALMEDFVALRREMSQALGYEAGAAPVPQTPTPPATVHLQAAGKQAQTPAVKAPVAPAAKKAESETETETSKVGKVILRLVLVIILLAAIWLIIQIFMGRWADNDEDEDGDEDDEDEDEEDDDEDFALGEEPATPEDAPDKDVAKPDGDSPGEEKKPS